MSITDFFKRGSGDSEREKLLAEYRGIVEQAASDKASADELTRAQTIRQLLELDGTLQSDVVRMDEAVRLAASLKGASKRRAACDEAEQHYRDQVEATRKAIAEANLKLDAARQAYNDAFDQIITDIVNNDRAAGLGGEVLAPICDRLKLPRTAHEETDRPRNPRDVIAQVEAGHGEPRTVDRVMAAALGIVA